MTFRWYGEERIGDARCNQANPGVAGIAAAIYHIPNLKNIAPVRP